MNTKRHWKHVCMAVAIALLVLSLRHLAHGVEMATGSSALESWLMAVGIDCAMVACELALMAGIRSRWITGLIGTTCVLSAGFNVLGFLEHTNTDLGRIMAVALGVFVPAAIYGLIAILNASRPRTVKRTRRR